MLAQCFPTESEGLTHKWEQVDPANADSEEGGYLENCLLPEFSRVKDTGASCTGLLSPPNRDDLERG